MSVRAVVFVAVVAGIGLVLAVLGGDGETPPPRAELPSTAAVEANVAPATVDRVAVTAAAAVVVLVAPASVATTEATAVAPTVAVDYDALIRGLVPRDEFIDALVQHVRAVRPEDYEVSPQLGAQVYEGFVEFAAREYRYQDLMLAAEEAGQPAKDLAFRCTRRALVGALPGLIDAIRTGAVIVGVAPSTGYHADFTAEVPKEDAHQVRLAFHRRGWRVSLVIDERALPAEEWTKVLEDARRSRAEDARRREASRSQRRKQP